MSEDIVDLSDISGAVANPATLQALSLELVCDQIHEICAAGNDDKYLHFRKKEVSKCGTH